MQMICTSLKCIPSASGHFPVLEHMVEMLESLVVVHGGDMSRAESPLLVPQS